MPPSSYDRLTALDNSFLLLERDNAYMHVASTQIYDGSALRDRGSSIGLDQLRKLTAASLHRIPRYRQKLSWIPFQNRAVWRDDDRFNIDYHIRHTALPRPGTDAQLKRLSARIMQQHLDRSRPLWELWLVDGLENDRFAVISKAHHCMIDGVSGVDLLKILMSPTPEQEIPTEPLYVPRPGPSGIDLLRDELTRRLRLPFDAFQDIRHFVDEAQDVRRELLVRARALAETLGTTLSRTSETPFNQTIGPHRRFDWITMDLEEVKRIHRTLGGSLNDVVLSIATGAIRRFLQHRRVDPDDIEFRIMAPVSVRSENEGGTLGNRVSAWLLDLPVDKSDPRARLDAIRTRTSELKKSKQAVAASMLTQAADWGSSTLLALGARNVTRMLPFNMVITNVPGPQLPLYTLGAQMLEVFPHVPLLDNLGLGIALMSYDGKLCWGFNADYDLVPDLADFLKYINASYEELHALVEAVTVRRADETPAAKVVEPVSISPVEEVSSDDPGGLTSPRAKLQSVSRVDPS